MKRSGKEFNATALKENTELRVDKVTLQKDLRTNRKALDKAQADLESYKKQFEEYADKVKRRHMNESTKEELDQLRRDIAERDAKIELLEKSSTSSKAQDDERLQKLQDEVADLEAELRAKDMELDEKDDELERFQEKASTGVGAQQALDEKEQEIVAMQEQLKYAEEEIAATIKKHKLQLQTCQSEAESMADQLGDSRSKLAKAEDAASEAVSAQRRLEAAEFERSTSLRQQSNTVETVCFRNCNSQKAEIKMPRSCKTRLLA
jgi:chromosome segregation ATPase